ncbi:hypothetical protein FKG94_28225 [Exilibacterium tricleocarpae]|uniref:Uncharacterized protein n=1 Tax=Exilibacterium tricleocarpae TaxID=2591008 RepID=A0A545SL31_9GAMM|nr:hypothetical protein FKG94_28225 [Exilibacterium tricleocarpae]
MTPFLTRAPGAKLLNDKLVHNSMPNYPTVAITFLPFDSPQKILAEHLNDAVMGRNGVGCFVLLKHKTTDGVEVQAALAVEH